MRYLKNIMLWNVGLLLLCAGQVQAILVTPDDDATNLTSAILGSGITPTSVAYSGQDNGVGAISTGTYTNASGTYGIGSGIVISSGDVSDYSDGPNTNGGNTTNFGPQATAAQQALLFPISGQAFHFDVTQIDIIFDADATTDTVFFNVVFGSDEYPEFQNSTFIDAFGIYLNGTNIAVFGGDPINIDHPDMAAITGTELDGVLDPAGPGQVMKFSAAITPLSMGNTLTFILADSGDSSLDSTVYISGFGNVAPDPDPDPTNVPLPGTLALLGIGILGLGWRKRKDA